MQDEVHCRKQLCVDWRLNKERRFYEAGTIRTLHWRPGIGGPVYRLSDESLQGAAGTAYFYGWEGIMGGERKPGCNRIGG